MISKGTFGGSKAADKLNDILIVHGDSKQIKFVARNIHYMQDIIKNLQDLQSKSFYTTTLQIYKAVIDKTIDDTIIELHPAVKSHLKNHLTVLYREATRRFSP